MDSSGQPVEFSIVVSSSNAQRDQIATLVQADLKAIGIAAHVVPMESRSANDRVLNTHDYEAIVMGLVSGDADPTPDMNVLMSNGQTHLWHLGEKDAGHSVGSRTRPAHAEAAGHPELPAAQENL